MIYPPAAIRTVDKTKIANLQSNQIEVVAFSIRKHLTKYCEKAIMSRLFQRISLRKGLILILFGAQKYQENLR